MLASNLAKVQSTGETQDILYHQLVKYKNLVNTKQDKLHQVEADIKKRQKIVEKKQKVYQTTIKERQSADWNGLARLKQQVKARKDQYVRMKNVIIAESEALKIQDDDLTVLKGQYEHKRMTIELFKREIEEKKALFDVQLRNQTS